MLRRAKFALFAILVGALALGVLEHVGIIPHYNEEQWGRILGAIVIVALLLSWVADIAKKRR